jgi:hypothetical protein
MALTYTWKQFIQRCRQHIVNDFPSSEFNITENETLLYINEAMSFGLVGSVWNGAKMMGTMEVPDAYEMTFQLAALKFNNVRRKWYSTLPQPPIGLPLGYSINRIYFANTTYGEGVDGYPIKSKRIGYRNNMPKPFGFSYQVENQIVWMEASDGSSLLNQTCYVQIPITRAASVNDVVNLPDDAQKIIFDLVVARMKDRLQLPQDIIADDLTEGNKSS